MTQLHSTTVITQQSAHMHAIDSLSEQTIPNQCGSLELLIFQHCHVAEQMHLDVIWMSKQGMVPVKLCTFTMAITCLRRANKGILQACLQMPKT